MPDASNQTLCEPRSPLLERLRQYPPVPRQWHTSGLAVLVASGPSLTREDVAYCRRCVSRPHVLVVSDSWQYAPWADALYSYEAAWWNHHQGVPAFRGQKWSSVPLESTSRNVDLDIRPQADSVEQWALQWVRGEDRLGLSFDPQLIHYGSNSGYQALNLAILFGARRIVLLGYDMQSTGGREHFFGPHPHPLRRWSDFAKFADMFRAAVPDLAAHNIEVINCSRETALDCFPRARLKDAL